MVVTTRQRGASGTWWVTRAAAEHHSAQASPTAESDAAPMLGVLEWRCPEVRAQQCRCDWGGRGAEREDLEASRQVASFLGSGSPSDMTAATGAASSPGGERTSENSGSNGQK